MRSIETGTRQVSKINKKVHKMENVSNKIMKRIEKLLAMSRNNTNENEAAIATKRLHALLAEYNLSEAAIEDREQDIETARF